VKAKDDVEMEKAIAAKAVRAAIRLKYSNLADVEINRKLPEVISAIEVAAVKGEPFSLNVGALFED
jgi:hypothetical protein